MDILLKGLLESFTPPKIEPSLSPWTFVTKEKNGFTRSQWKNPACLIDIMNTKVTVTPIITGTLKKGFLRLFLKSNTPKV